MKKEIIIEDKNSITDKIKKTVLSIDASAQVILYGSHARGTANKESDWDILILINKPIITIKDEQLFRHQLFEIELETGETISTFVYSLTDWNARMSVTPLYNNIKREGIYLWIIMISIENL